MTTAQCVQSAGMAKAGMVTGGGLQTPAVGTQRVTLGSSPSVGEDGVAA